MSNTKKLTTLLLGQEDIIRAGVFDWEAAVADVELVYRMLHEGDAEEINSPQIWLKEESASPAFFAFHPGIVRRESQEIAGIKVVGRFPDNPSQGNLPSIVGAIELLDPEWGRPLAFLEGSLITAVRTGMSTAVGAKYLAREESEFMGVIGAGVMARTQLLALNHVLKHLKEVFIFDIDSSRAEAFSREMAERTGLRMQLVASSEEAVKEADVVIPATTVRLEDRYIESSWLKEGAFLANVSDNDYKFEAVQKADRIIVDGNKQFGLPVVLGAMVKEGLLEIEEVSTIGSVICGDQPGRSTAGEIILFSALGLGLHDIMIAKRIYRKAIELGLGQEWVLWDQPYWM